VAAVTRCERFEAEGLLLLERGERLDGHFATCPDCCEARAAYEVLRAEIAEAGAGVEPPADWQARVWERVEERRRRPFWGWVWAPLGAAALAATLFFAIPRTPAAPSLLQEITPGATVHRSASAAPGDRLTLRAETAGSPHAELRLYRNGRELLLRCPGAAACRRAGSELHATWTLPSAGRYQAVLLLDDEPLPATGKSLDADAGAALARGGRVVLGEEIEVR
jgi:hypothetical protein